MPGNLPADGLDVEVSQRTSQRRAYGARKELPEADRGERTKQDVRESLQVPRETTQNRK